MKKLNFIIFIFVILGFLHLGCAHRLNINVDEIGHYSKPLIEPLPIKVGVYYGNDFRTYKTIQENDYTQGVTRISKIQLGKANIALFDYISSHLFENVISIQHFPNELENLKNIDLILEPKISNYDYSERTVFYEPAAQVNIEYRINFYSPDGKQIGTWTISGESSRYITWHGIEVMRRHTSVKKLTHLSMREVAAQFFADFCNQSDIKKHFDKKCKQ